MDGATIFLGGITLMVIALIIFTVITDRKAQQDHPKE
jgi:hypothetical protein